MCERERASEAGATAGNTRRRNCARRAHGAKRSTAGCTLHSTGAREKSRARALTRSPIYLYLYTRTRFSFSGSAARASGGGDDDIRTYTYITRISIRAAALARTLRTGCERREIDDHDGDGRWTRARAPPRRRCCCCCSACVPCTYNTVSAAPSRRDRDSIGARSREGSARRGCERARTWTDPAAAVAVVALSSRRSLFFSRSRRERQGERKIHGRREQSVDTHIRASSRRATEVTWRGREER